MTPPADQPDAAPTPVRQFVLPAELVDVARQVIEANRAAGKKIVVAESCTGGLVTAALTEISGSSDVFQAGFVTYSNEAKMDMLDVSLDVLETFGAVSIAVAWAMAQGALEHSDADTAVAITGVAGPQGGTDKKPVGTVVFARARKGADPKEIVADLKEFGDLGRGGVRLQAALCALDLLMPVEEEEEAGVPSP
jgi:nicotinamide-nucleotide amidase